MGKVPWRLAAGLVGTAAPSSPLWAQRLKERQELISLFLARMTTAHSSHRWDLGAGRAPVPPLLGRELVLAGSAPHRDSWCLSWTQLGAQPRYLAGDRQPVPDTSSMSPVCCHLLQSTGVWLMYIHWWDVPGLFPACPSCLSTLASAGG